MKEDPAEHGVIGYAIRTAASLRKSLDFWMKYQDITGPIVRMHYSESGGSMVLFAHEQWIGGAVASVDVEHIFYFFCELARQVTSIQLVRLTQAEPQEPALYKECFGCDVQFSQPRDEIWFSSEGVDKSLPQSNPEMHEICVRQCEMTYRKLMLEGTLPDQVRRLMLASSGIFPSEIAIAEHLGMSARSLRRQLAAEGLAFRELLDECRISLAKQYMQITDYKLAVIAEKVGYSTIQSFSRAFKRVTGTTPGVYREHQD